MFSQTPTKKHTPQPPPPQQTTSQPTHKPEVRHRMSEYVIVLLNQNQTFLNQLNN